MMRKHVRVLSRPHMAAGFELTGLRTESVATAEEAARMLEEFVRLEDPGVVLIEDDLYAALPEAVARRVESSSLPLVVRVPTPRWEEGELPDYLVELLRRAIGYRVRFR